MGSLSRRALAWLVPAFAMLLAPPRRWQTPSAQRWPLRLRQAALSRAPSRGRPRPPTRAAWSGSSSSSTARSWRRIGWRPTAASGTLPEYVYGSHSLEARSFDNLGNRSAPSQTVKVDNLLAPIASVAGSVALAGSICSGRSPSLHRSASRSGAGPRMPGKTLPRGRSWAGCSRGPRRCRPRSPCPRRCRRAVLGVRKGDQLRRLDQRAGRDRRWPGNRGDQ